MKGEFHLFYQGQRHVGSRPDRDSMWFQPNDATHLAELDGRSVDFNGGGFTQLRFGGIDALELHYAGSNHELEAPTVAARDRLLRLASLIRPGAENGCSQYQPPSIRPTWQY